QHAFSKLLHEKFSKYLVEMALKPEQSVANSAGSSPLGSPRSKSPSNDEDNELESRRGSASTPTPKVGFQNMPSVTASSASSAPAVSLTAYDLVLSRPQNRPDYFGRGLMGAGVIGTIVLGILAGLSIVACPYLIIPAVVFLIGAMSNSGSNSSPSQIGFFSSSSQQRALPESHEATYEFLV
ncbi:MAG: hypothetical protein K0U12_07210, partial [Gammaproteobacteria bacterium]|nr:hypothetical protein [Gammaproteobacteria bacterium]